MPGMGWVPPTRRKPIASKNAIAFVVLRPRSEVASGDPRPSGACRTTGAPSSDPGRGRAPSAQEVDVEVGGPACAVVSAADGDPAVDHLAGRCRRPPATGLPRSPAGRTARGGRCGARAAPAGCRPGSCPDSREVPDHTSVHLDHDGRLGLLVGVVAGEQVGQLVRVTPLPGDRVAHVSGLEADLTHGLAVTDLVRSDRWRPRSIPRG